MTYYEKSLHQTQHKSEKGLGKQACQTPVSHISMFVNKKENVLLQQMQKSTKAYITLVQ